MIIIDDTSLSFLNFMATSFCSWQKAGLIFLQFPVTCTIICRCFLKVLREKRKSKSVSKIHWLKKFKFSQWWKQSANMVGWKHFSSFPWVYVLTMNVLLQWTNGTKIQITCRCDLRTWYKSSSPTCVKCNIALNM